MLGNTDQERQTFCNFHGDTTLDDIPTTTKAALKAYRNLSQKAKGSRAIVEFTLSPISEYCGSEATSIINSIPKSTTERLSEIVLEIDKTVAEAHELFQLESSNMYAKELGQQVDFFLKALKKFQTNWRSRLIKGRLC